MSSISAFVFSPHPSNSTSSSSRLAGTWKVLWGQESTSKINAAKLAMVPFSMRSERMPRSNYHKKHRS